jgi:hypothetical protein
MRAGRVEREPGSLRGIRIPMRAPADECRNHVDAVAVVTCAPCFQIARQRSPKAVAGH